MESDKPIATQLRKALVRLDKLEKKVFGTNPQSVPDEEIKPKKKNKKKDK